MNLEETAEKVAKRMNVDKRYSLDPMTIQAIVQVIIAVIQAYRECQKTPAEATYDFNNVGIIKRWRLRRIIRQKVDPKLYDQIGSELAVACGAVGSGMCEEDVKSLFDQVP